MMRSVRCSVTLSMCGASVLVFGAPLRAQPTPTISLKAVRLTGVCLGGDHTDSLCAIDADCGTGRCGGEVAPTNRVVAAPGSILTTEIFLSDWSPMGDHLSAYKVTIGTASLLGSLHGRLSPHDSYRPCDNDSDCVDLGRPCVAGRCGGDPADSDGVRIDTSRADYVFYPQPIILSVAAVPDARVGATALHGGEYVRYDPPPKYAGTIVWDVSADACGVFTVSVEPLGTSLIDEARRPIEPWRFEPLVVDVSAASCPPILAASPLAGAIDARQPAEPDGSRVAGWDTVALHFPDATIAARAADVTRYSARRSCGIPDSPVDLDTVEVSVPDPEWVTVHFAQRISPANWTCVTYLPNDQETCLGCLPGDVNNDLTTDDADIETLIDCLQGDRPCALHQCDIDRSGACAPGDILRLVDVLQGGDTYEVWRSRSLRECGP